MSTNYDIEKYGHEMTSPYNDGYTAFHYKQKIMQTLWECQYWLSKSPTFAGEDEWIAENKPKKLDNLSTI